MSAAPGGIGAIVLAAGAGRRFGGPKQLAALGGRPLLAHALEALRAVPEIRAGVVVLGARAAEVRAGVGLAPFAAVDCSDWAEGQAASLRAGIAALPPVDAAVVLLGDQPGITPRAISEAIARFDAQACDAVRTTYDGVPGHPVVLGRAVLEAATALRGDTGARSLLAGFRVRTWDATGLADPADVDTPEALEALRARSS